MPASQERHEILKGVAQNVLKAFEVVSDIAKSELAGMPSMNPSALATVNTFTYTEAIKSLDAANSEKLRNLVRLVQEPAIARVTVIDEKDERHTYFFSRATPEIVPGGELKLASYKAPIGRIASLPVGDGAEISTPGGEEISGSR